MCTIGFSPPDLSFYVKGGRISKASGWFGTLLNICPLLNMDDQGRLIPRFKIRGKMRLSVRLKKRWRNLPRTARTMMQMLYLPVGLAMRCSGGSRSGGAEFPPSQWQSDDQQHRHDHRQSYRPRHCGPLFLGEQTGKIVFRSEKPARTRRACPCRKSGLRHFFEFCKGLHAADCPLSAVNRPRLSLERCKNRRTGRRFLRIDEG